MSNEKKKEMKESEEKFKMLFNSSPEAVLYVDKDFETLDMNPKFEKLFGYSIDEIKGKDINEFIIPEDRKDEGQKLDKKSKKGYTFYETVRKRKDGSLVPVSISAGPIISEGKVIGITVTYKDITEQKETERKLSAIYDLSREMTPSLDLDQISKIVLDATKKVLNFDYIDLFLTDEEKNELYLTASRGWKERKTYERIPLSGEKGITAYVARTGKTLNVSDVRKDKRYLESAKEARSELCVPIKVKNKIIGVIDAESKELNAFSEEDQRLLETLASQAGIAIENEKLFTELSSLKEFNETIVSSLNEGIWIEDEKGFCTYANHRMEEMLGYESLVGKHWKEIIVPEEIGHMGKETGTRPSKRTSSYESTLLTKDGDNIPVVVSAAPLFEKEKFVGTIGVMIDIGEQKKVEKELKNSEKLYKSLSDLNKQLLENSPAGIMNINKEMKVEYLNPEMRRILSLPFGKEYEATAMKIREVPLIEETELSSVFEDLKGGETTVEEASFAFPNGEKGYLTLKGVPLMEENEFKGAVLIFDDNTERKKAEIEVERRAREQSVLYELAQTLTTHLNVNEVLEETYQQADRLVDTSNFFIAFYDKEKEEIRFPFQVTESEIDKETLTVIPADQGVSGYIIRNRTNVLIQDNLSEWLEDHGIELVGEAAQSLLGVPLIVGDTVLGVMAVQNYTTPNVYDEHDQELFVSIANQAAIAIQNAQLYEQAQQEITDRKQAEQMQSVLHKIANAVNTTEDLPELFDSIKKHLGEVIDTTNFVIALYNKETDTVSLPYLEDEKDTLESFPAGKTLTSYVVEKGTPMLLTEEDKKELAEKGELEPVGTTSKVWLGAPLKMGKETIGVVAVQSYTDPDLYTEKHLEILEFVSGQIAIAVERKRAEEALRESEGKIKQIHKVAVEMEAADSEEEIYRLAMAAAGNILDFSIASIMYADGKYLKIGLTTEKNVPEEYKMSIDEGVGGKTYRTGESFLIDDITKDKDAKPTKDTYRSTISVPIGSYGVFQAHSNLAGHFTEEDLEMAELLLSHAREALKRIRTEKELRQSEQKHKTLFERNLAGVYRTTLEGEILDCNDSFVQILGYDSRKEILGHEASELYFDKSNREEFIARLKKQGMLTTNETQLRRKDGTPVWTLENVNLVEEEKSNSLVIQGTIIDITSQKETERKLSAIYDLSREISLSLDLDQISKIIMDTTEKVLEFGNVDLFLIDEEKNELRVKEARGLMEPERSMVIPLSGEKSIAAYVARTGKSLNIPDVRKDKRYILGLKGAKSELCAPIKVKNKIIGVIDAENKELNAFSEEDQRLLETLASQAGIAIENEKLYEQAQKDITERKKAEEELRKSEEQYRLITENTDDLIALATFSLNPVYTYVSPSTKKVMGYEPEEVIGKPCFDLVHPDDKKKMLPLLKKYIGAKAKKLFTGKDSEASETIENRVRDKSGNWHYLQSTVNLVGDQMLLISRDITEQKRMKKVLKESEEKYKSLAKNSPFGIAIINKEDLYEYINPKFTEMFGYSLKDIPTGKDWLKKAYPDPKYRKKVVASWINDLKKAGQGETRPHIFTVRCKDGSKKVIHFRPVTMPNRKQFVTYEDITKRKKAEEGLRKSEEKYKTLVDSAEDVIYMHDLKGNFKAWNPQAKKLIGYSDKELLNMNMAKILTPESLEIAKKKIADKIMTKKSAPPYQLSIVRKDGVIVPVEITSSPLIKEGKVVAIQGICRDITERKKVEKERKEAKEAAEFYADVLTHDMGNINQSIMASLYLIENAEDEKKRKQYIEKATRSIGRSKKLAKNIRVLKKINQRKVSRVNLNKSIKRSIENIKERFDRDIQVNLDVEKRCYVKANKFLDEAFASVLENAVEYTLKDPVKIDIHTEKKGGKYNIYIRDYGLGISEKKRTDIVKNLETLEKRTGIGLYLAKKILENFDGRFEIKDAEKGTKILITLSAINGGNEL
ncbi:MAG: PAS domain S-box protein [Euryarchaeota archaeon]|nr:PAS domain S-box protein [Euryarchaeota archaeon]